ncbi:MAG: DUF1850 domain-containing protein [Thermodesulfobacteriota bacterium]
MRTKTRPARLLLLAAAGLALAITVMAFLPGGLELSIAPLAGGRPLLVLPLKVGERFTLRYYHSVENAPIWEVHQADADGRLYLEEERYQKIGAGMGHIPGQGRVVRRAPYEAIVGLHRPVGRFVLVIGSPGVDHTILWRGRAFNLSARAPHRAVRFAARPVSLLHRLWRGLWPHAATPR